MKSSYLNFIDLKYKPEKDDVVCSNKTCFTVTSGGLHPGLVPDVFKIFGNDCVIQAGGGVLGHPGGTEAGAKGLRQAIDAVSGGYTLEEYSKSHKELKQALEYWKHTKPK